MGPLASPPSITEVVRRLIQLQMLDQKLPCEAQARHAKDRV